MTTSILIIDKSDREAQNIRKRLSLLGYEICGTFRSLDQSLREYEGEPPALVILDAESLSAELSSVAETIAERWSCPIVFTLTNFEGLQPGQLDPADGEIYLLKPVTDDAELDSTVQLCLKQHELETVLHERRKKLPPDARPKLDDSYLSRRIETLIGELARIYGQLQKDRLNRVRNVEPLIYSEILFKTIFQHTPVGIALVGINEGFLMANAKFCSFLCYEKPELLELNASDIIHPADIDPQDIFPPGGDSPVVRSEKRFLRNDGRFVLGQLGVTPISDDSGKTVFYLWQVEDVTDQKRVEHERSKLESIVEHSPDFIAMITASGHFRYVNPTGLQLIGANRAANQLAVSDVSGSTPDGDYTLVDLCDMVRRHGRWMGELLIRRMSDGAAIPVAAHGFLLSSPTSTSQPIIAVIARDLTETHKREQEHRLLQDQLIRAEKMHSLGMLAGGVAHDLNNILGPLVAYPDLVLRKLPADSPLREQVERMRDSACSAVNVVQDLLTLARRGRHEQIPVNINEVVTGFLQSALVEKIRSESPETTVKVHLSKTQPVVLGSATQLEKVVMNLVVNAFDAIGGPGTVTITTGVRTLEKLSTGYADFDEAPYAFVSVKDTGCGIDPDDIKTIFEPYYSTKKMKGRSGTGLGLAIVYGIIKDHNGYYDLITEPGKGTEFIVYLPNAAAETSVRTAAQCLDGNGRLLVVDDDEQQRNVARECLECYGYFVESVSSGREALKLMEERDFDLVLLDMVMEEGFDGLDTYRAMKQLKGDVKAIIVSGSALADRVRKALDLGVGKYVQKPYTAEELAKAVRDEIDRDDTKKPAAPATARR